MKKSIQQIAGFVLALVLCLAIVPLGNAAGGEDVGLTITSQSIVSFSNAISHYVGFDISFHDVSRLTVRVYNPEGTQVSFATRQTNRNKEAAVKALSWAVKETSRKKTGIEIYFKKGCKTGTWSITVTALDKKKNELDTATLEVNVRDQDPLECADYDKVHEMILDGEAPVQPGKIRMVTQLPSDWCFDRDLWKSKTYDLTEDSTKMCTRAVFSMAVSYLGIDCSPVRMSELTRAHDIFYTYEDVARKLGNIRRKEGTIEELWKLYEEGKGSPVCIHFTYSGGGMHAMLLIARDSKNPELYYAINSTVGINTTSAGGLEHDHVIPILIDEPEIGCMIQSPLIKKYNGGKLDSVWSWELID